MKLFLSLLVCLVVTAVVLIAQEARSPLEGVYSAAQAKRGESTYEQNCVSCHGANLGGSEGGPALIGVEFDARWDGSKLSELFKLMKETMPQSAPGSLVDRQYSDVLSFILSRASFPAGETDLSSNPDKLGELTYKPPKR